MKRLFSTVFILFAIAFMANPLLAQDQEEGEESLLPDIDPQDIEIRSQFQARFPGLSRQPILGFSPTPRVYQIDPGRQPFMETQEQVVADLPVSELSRPEPPEYTPFSYASDINAYGRAGMGNYITPELKFWGVHKINGKSYLGGDLDYTSSDGHLENQQSSYRFFNGSGEYAVKLGSKSLLSLNAGVRNSFNHLFETPVLPEAANTPRKDYSGFNIGATFQQFSNTVTGWVVQGNARFYEVDLKADEFSGNNEEFVYNGSVAKKWAGARPGETFAIKVGARGAEPVEPENRWLTARGGIEYERLYDYSTRIKAEVSAYYGQDAFEDKLYIAPAVEVQHPINEQLTVIGKASGKPMVKSAEELHEENRFLDVNYDYRHYYRAQGQLEGHLEYSQIGSIKMGIRYENISDYPLFLRQEVVDSVGSQELNFYESSHEDISRMRAYAGASHQIVPERFWLSGEAYVQMPKLIGGGDIPYEERVGFSSSARLRLFEKLTLEAWADYIGPREAQTSGTIESYLLAGTQVNVQINEKIGAYMKFSNLLDEEYEVWPGYVERPFQATGGITIQF